jgi:hypothetical protein
MSVMIVETSLNAIWLISVITIFGAKIGGSSEAIKGERNMEEDTSLGIDTNHTLGIALIPDLQETSPNDIKRQRMRNQGFSSLLLPNLEAQRTWLPTGLKYG